MKYNANGIKWYSMDGLCLQPYMWLSVFNGIIFVQFMNGSYLFFKGKLNGTQLLFMYDKKKVQHQYGSRQHIVSKQFNIQYCSSHIFKSYLIVSIVWHTIF